MWEKGYQSPKCITFRKSSIIIPSLTIHKDRFLKKTSLKTKAFKYEIKIYKPWLEMFTCYFENLQKVQQSRLPFKITMESLEEFPIFEDGYNYSFTGIKLVFRRNNLSLLTGGFYFPTLVFSLLSLLSFAIKPEVVNYCVIFLIHSNNILIPYIFPIIV